MLALFTGMRKGELMGLEFKDIDCENKTISIKRTSQYLTGKGVFTKQPKTELSSRTIETVSKLMKFKGENDII